MDLDLAGKHVLVTGASRGIGLATVKAFLAQGATVTTVSRRSMPELDATGDTFLSADLSTTDGSWRSPRAWAYPRAVRPPSKGSTSSSGTPSPLPART